MISQEFCECGTVIMWLTCVPSHPHSGYRAEEEMYVWTNTAVRVCIIPGKTENTKLWICWISKAHWNKIILHSLYNKKSSFHTVFRIRYDIYAEFKAIFNELMRHSGQLLQYFCEPIISIKIPVAMHTNKIYRSTIVTMGW